jgi:hypothetical protein
MTEYADLKIAPVVHRVLKTAAEDQFDQQFRALSLAGHEAAIAWLVFRADDDVRQRALAEHGYDSIGDLVDDLAAEDGADGRFANDDNFDPLAAIRTPRQMGDD